MKQTTKANRVLTILSLAIAAGLSRCSKDDDSPQASPAPAGKKYKLPVTPERLSTWS